MNKNCPICNSPMKPTGNVIDTNPAVIVFKCENCDSERGIFENDLEGSMVSYASIDKDI